MTYTFHEDPGHGWLAVPVSELIALGVFGAISGYSYISRDGRTAYLEEDCDFAAFWAAYKARHGTEPQYRRAYSERTFIRSLPSFPAAADWRTQAQLLRASV